MSLFSRLRAVVSGDDYLDGEYDDELDYDAGDSTASTAATGRPASSALALTSDFSSEDPFSGSNVIACRAFLLRGGGDPDGAPQFR